MAAAAPSKTEVLSLFRTFLRTARQFSDYNIREYTRRRTADVFRENRALSDVCYDLGRDRTGRGGDQREGDEIQW